MFSVIYLYKSRYGDPGGILMDSQRNSDPYDDIKPQEDLFSIRFRAILDIVWISDFANFILLKPSVLYTPLRPTPYVENDRILIL